MAHAILTSLPDRETPTPAADGVTTDFLVSKDFTPGTVSVWHNGIRLQADLDTGYSESLPRTVSMKEPPLTGDTLAVEFVPA